MIILMKCSYTEKNIVVSSEEGSSFLPKASVLFEYFYYNGKILVSADIIKKIFFKSMYSVGSLFCLKFIGFSFLSALLSYCNTPLTRIPTRSAGYRREVINDSCYIK